jgi:hypothetical protein
MDIAADAEYYQASLVELIKIDLKFGYYQEAQTLIELLDCGRNYRIFLSSIAYRKDGLATQAIRYVGFDPDPDEFLLAENYLLNDSEETKERLVSFTAGDEKSLLPIALDYLDMGCTKEAETVLALIANPSMKSKLALGLQKKAQKNDDILHAVRNEK